jgi:hypothetical protein
MYWLKEKNAIHNVDNPSFWVQYAKAIQKKLHVLCSSYVIYSPIRLRHGKIHQLSDYYNSEVRLEKPHSILSFILIF